MGVPVSFLQSSFLGGEWSQSAQGRIDLPAYRTALNVCHNIIPIETGAALRRPGTKHAGPTRGAGPARVIAFDFKEATPHSMEFTDGKLRFRRERAIVTTNDEQTITAISSASPAVLTTALPHGWSTGNQVEADSDVTALHNRLLAITVTSATAFSLADALTGTAINGAALGAFSAGTVRRVLELTTPYVGETWADVRSVQAETTAVLLNGTLPQVLDVTSLPTDDANATFDLSDADFLDGPYLDPFPGSYITASALSGVVTLTLSFQAYDSAKAYDIGVYVTSSGQGYKSRTAANQGNTPASSPSNWQAVNAGDPINDGAGFISADIGRLIRLFSEPALWDVGATYTTEQIVAYTIGEVTGYWRAAGSISAGVKPGTSTSWTVVTGVAIARWTWGRVRGISASGIVSPGTPIGDLTGGGGLAAAFDGTTSKSFASAANVSQSTTTYPAWGVAVYAIGSVVQYGGRVYQKILLNLPGYLIYEVLPPAGNLLWQDTGSTVSNITFDSYAGTHFSPATQIASVTITPTVDVGFTNSPAGTLVLNLRGKATAPSSATDGTLLGTVTIANTLSPVALVSADQTTAFNYVWVEAVAAFTQPLPDDGSHSFTAKLGIAQIQYFAPNIANGSVITAQIVGDPLLYSGACRKWRLGAYGGTNGYPKCGTYSDSRLWLSGVIGNRVDASKSGVIRNGSLVLDFAPTAASGAVADDNAITAVADGPDVNAIFWMAPEEQGIVCGSQAGEWLIAPAAPGAMSPTNTSMRRKTRIGCANIEPCRTEHTLVFVQKVGRKVMEYFADVFSGRLSAPNLSQRAKHLTVGGIAELAYQQELAPIIWARTNDGRLIGATYKRDKLTTSAEPDIIGWHRHTHGAARRITSMCVGASAGGNLDSLTLVTVDDDGAYHVEVMADLLDEGFLFTDVCFLDDAIIPTSFAISTDPVAGAPYGGVTLYGLWSHEGKDVTPYIVGVDCGMTTGAEDALVEQTFTVEAGAIFVPFGDGVSAGTGGGLFTLALVLPYDGLADLPMLVGFPFTSQGQLVRPQTPADAGTQAGPGFGRLRRINQYAVQLYGAVQGMISFGTDFTTRTLRPAILKKKDQKRYTRQEFYSGIHRDTIVCDEDLDGMISWQITRPHPAFVIALGGNNIKTEEAS